MLGKELVSIKNKLFDLIEKNQNAEDELEKLDRDEFVIDINQWDWLLEKCNHECEKIRHDGKKEKYRLDCLKERLK